jgi:uncharacterized protein YecE (DUF72 family)
MPSERAAERRSASGSKSSAVAGITGDSHHLMLAWKSRSGLLPLVRPALAMMPRIGCAGWAISAQHRHRFGDGIDLLQRYASRFDAVEINSSFYRPHLPKTYARWADAVPDDFRFAVKMPRAMTHQARLGVDASMLLAEFLDQVGMLGNKLGVILIQLPPSLKLDHGIASAFFSQLRRQFNGPVVCEPRHASWFDKATDGLWQQYRVGRVGADPSTNDAGGIPAGWTSLRYWRWHGSPKIYYSAYDDARLSDLAVHAATSADAATSWCIFDNTAAGHAVADALRLQELCSTALSNQASTARRADA